MVKNRIRFLLAQHAVKPSETSDLFEKAGRRWLEGFRLPEPDKLLLDEDVGLLGTLKDCIGETETLIGKLASGDKAVG